MLHLEKLGALGDRHDPAVVVSITTVVEFRFPQLLNSTFAPLNHPLEPNIMAEFLGLLLYKQSYKKCKIQTTS